MERCHEVLDRGGAKRSCFAHMLFVSQVKRQRPGGQHQEGQPSDLDLFVAWFAKRLNGRTFLDEGNLGPTFSQAAPE